MFVKAQWQLARVFVLVGACQHICCMDQGIEAITAGLGALAVEGGSRSVTVNEKVEEDIKLEAAAVFRRARKRACDVVLPDIQRDEDDALAYPTIDRREALCHWPLIDLISPRAAAERRLEVERQRYELRRELEGAQEALRQQLLDIDRWYTGEERKISCRPGNNNFATQRLLGERDAKRRDAHCRVKHLEKTLGELPLQTPAQVHGLMLRRVALSADLSHIGSSSASLAASDLDGSDGTSCDELATMMVDEELSTHGEVDSAQGSESSPVETPLQEATDWDNESWFLAIEERDKVHVKAVLMLCKRLAHGSSVPKHFSLRARRDVAGLGNIRERAAGAIHNLVLWDKWQDLVSSVSKAGFCQHSFADAQELILWRTSIHFKRLVLELYQNPFFRIATCAKCVRLVAS